MPPDRAASGAGSAGTAAGAAAGAGPRFSGEAGPGRVRRRRRLRPAGLFRRRRLGLRGSRREGGGAPSTGPAPDAGRSCRSVSGVTTASSSAAAAAQVQAGSAAAGGGRRPGLETGPHAGGEGLEVALRRLGGERGRRLVHRRQLREEGRALGTGREMGRDRGALARRQLPVEVRRETLALVAAHDASRLPPAGRPEVGGERLRQALARPEEPAHHRARADAERLRDLLVGHLLHRPQDEHRALLRRAARRPPRRARASPPRRAPPPSGPGSAEGVSAWPSGRPSSRARGERTWFTARFAAMRHTQGPKGRPSSKRSRDRQARTNASWATSSATSWARTIRRATP